MFSTWTGLYVLIHEYVNPAAKALANYRGKVIYKGVLLSVQVQLDLDLWYKWLIAFASAKVRQGP